MKSQKHMEDRPSYVCELLARCKCKNSGSPPLCPHTGQSQGGGRGPRAPPARPTPGASSVRRGGRRWPHPRSMLPWGTTPTGLRHICALLGGDPKSKLLKPTPPDTEQFIPQQRDLPCAGPAVPGLCCGPTTPLCPEAQGQTRSPRSQALTAPPSVTSSARPLRGGTEVPGQQVTCPRHCSRTKCFPRVLRVPHKPSRTGTAEPWWTHLPDLDLPWHSAPGGRPALSSVLGWALLSLCLHEASSKSQCVEDEGRPRAMARRPGHRHTHRTGTSPTILLPKAPNERVHSAHRNGASVQRSITAKVSLPQPHPRLGQSRVQTNKYMKISINKGKAQTSGTNGFGVKTPPRKPKLSARRCGPPPSPPARPVCPQRPRAQAQD